MSTREMRRLRGSLGSAATSGSTSARPTTSAIRLGSSPASIMAARVAFARSLDKRQLS
ncbi:MAG: hypothetical protein N2038_01260 [Geminicoccaceae bacterium]|nr:hypothetical protein [Geminicoccaceae bacterium]MCX7628859.1 hypothetical protein [Geminicoccaceae bacterium]MDW8124200.1 hypothetical protein [Geminicoccaceae bacterium]MDW8340577.1 hypothetical protein [Geminicoccaceae bacterium]